LFGLYDQPVGVLCSSLVNLDAWPRANSPKTKASLIRCNASALIGSTPGIKWLALKRMYCSMRENQSDHAW